MSDAFISHQPVISRQGKLIASILSIHVDPASPKAMPEATETLRKIEEFWPTGQHAFFLGFNGALLTPALFDWMVPENATLIVRPESFRDDLKADLIAAIRANGAALLLELTSEAAMALGSGATFRFIGFDTTVYSPQQIQVLTTKLKAAGIPVACNVPDQKTYKECSDAGAHACAGWFCKLPTSAPGKALAPNQAHIVRLLNLVRNNADVSQIETALKQDVALSYKLLRYINSAGFGLSCEIQSFRHAVTMLGYDKLHKWLSLLLVTASKDPMAPALMHTALTRARLMEQLGHGLVAKGELDNLFITGAFSMLDVLLGVTMEKALGEMHLPESISEALQNRSGQYAPFFEIALACENGDLERLAKHTDGLGLDATRVNAALLQALSFAATMSV